MDVRRTEQSDLRAMGTRLGVPDCPPAHAGSSKAPGNGVRVTKVAFDSYDADYETIGDEVYRRCEATLPCDPGGCFYFNPEFTVYAPVLSKAFLMQARKCQGAWCRRLAKVLGRSTFRRQAGNRSYVRRQLGYHGIMFIRGQWIAPHDWDRILGRRRIWTTTSNSTKPEEAT